jgi:hypothetical protein
MVNIKTQNFESTTREELSKGKTNVAESDDTGRESSCLNLMEEFIQTTARGFDNHEYNPLAGS